MKKVPSLISAIAITSCVCASRIRLATDALPDAGVKKKLAICGKGLAGANKCTAFTYWPGLIGLSTVTV
jgi:hypothetical protein